MRLLTAAGGNMRLEDVDHAVRVFGILDSKHVSAQRTRDGYGMLIVRVDIAKAAPNRNASTLAGSWIFGDVVFLENDEEIERILGG